MAASGRLYTVGFNGVTLSAVQDMLGLYAGSSKIIALQQVNFGQITGTTVLNLKMRLRYLPATVTAGSGGSSLTPRPSIVGDAAATFTARANDTTQATSSGTAVDEIFDVINTINGYLWLPPIIGRPPLTTFSSAFTLSLDTAPSSLVFNGMATVEEFP